MLECLTNDFKCTKYKQNITMFPNVVYDIFLMEIKTTDFFHSYNINMQDRKLGEIYFGQSRGLNQHIDKIELMRCNATLNGNEN